MRLVILEGPDGAGKTTLAQALQMDFGMDYTHEGPPPADRDVLAYYFGRLVEAARRAPIILDRFALGERVYGPIIRGLDGVGEQGWLEMNAVLESLNAVQVVCLPPFEQCHAAWHERAGVKAEMILHEAVFKASYERWLWAATLPNQVLYDWTQPTSYDAIAALVARR